MKRIIKSLSLCCLFSLSLIFTGCWDPIFFELRKDVKPEKPTVSGNIPTITRYTAGGTEFLVLAADDGLRVKRADNESHGAWTTYPLPFELPSFNFDDTTISGQQLMTALASSDTLYIVSAKYETTGAEGMTIPSKINVWGKKISVSDGSLSGDGDWINITDKLSVDYFPVTFDEIYGYPETNFNFFQTNAPMAAHRHAYFCTYNFTSKTYDYYELSGTEVPVKFTIPTIQNSTEASSTQKGRVYSAAYYNGSVRFFTSEAASTDETYTAEATHLYYGDESTLKCITGSTVTELVTADAKISAIATCADSVLIGLGSIYLGAGGGGIKKISVVNGQPQTSFADFTTNADFQITDGYLVISMVNATPHKNETDSALYASVTFFNKNGVHENVGLWSYYPERGNWNRE